MGKAAGFALILAGVGTAAYVVPSFDTRDRAAERRVSDVAAITVAAPVAPAPQPRETTTIDKTAKPAAAAIETASAPSKPSEPIKIVTAPAPQKSDQRFALTKDIQRELHRVGCYAGDIDGEWNAQTRQAMKNFVDRVNATLPVDGPDHILRTLVSGHPGEACGKTCPAGQTASNGRCMPTQVQAQAPRKIDTRTAEVPRVSRNTEKQPDRQDFAAAPKAKNKPAAATETVVSSWAPTVVAAPIPQMVAPQPRAVPAPVVAAAPVSETASPATRPDLAGRMSVGVGAASPDALAKPVTADPAPAVAAPAPKAASKIVIKKRDGAVAKAPQAPAATPSQPIAPVPAIVDAQPKAQPGQQTAALKEADIPDATAVAAEPRKADGRRGNGNGSGVTVNRNPPPRYVSVYVSPQPVYREVRPRFGPSIFKRLERDAR